MRTIMHVDMNAYFASVEQQADPSLRGKPVAVVGSKTRTVILSPSYEARRFGVKTGMRLPEARRCCPQLVLVEAHNDRYTDICHRLIAIYQDFTDQVEVFSIDEVFLDVTGSLKILGSAETIARNIKKRIWEEHHLTCSVGIAPNKLLAKLASDMKKPDGLTVIRAGEVASVLEDLPVETMCGIGGKLTEALRAMGLRTCGQLGRAPVEKLRERFGILGENLHAMALGQDDRPVVSLGKEPDPKSMGHSMTFDRDLTEAEDMRCQILQLSEMVARRLRKHGFKGRTICLTVRYSDFHTFSRRVTSDTATFDGQDIYRKAVEILESLELARPVRLLGVGVSHLERADGSPTLFAEDRKRERAMKAMDRVNERYGEFTLSSATLLSRFHHKGIIPPSWRPESRKT